MLQWAPTEEEDVVKDGGVIERLKAAGRWQSYLLVSVALGGGGLLLLFLSGAVDNWAEELGVALFSAGLIGTVWQVAVDRWQVQRVRDALYSVLSRTRPGHGLTETRIGDVEYDDFRALIGSGGDIFATCLFDSRWREAWRQDLVRHLERGGSFRLCVPDPDDTALMAALARRHRREESPSRFQFDVRQLLDDVAQLAETRRGVVELRTCPTPGPSYTAYLFEHPGGGGGGLTRMYGHRMDPGGQLTEQTITRPGALYTLYREDFEALWAASSPYPRLPSTVAPTSMRVAVVGPGDATGQIYQLAEQVGSALAARQVLVVCGGLGGVMEAAARGARSRGGQVLGVLPGLNPAEGNRYLTEREPTGAGEARNLLLVDRADALIAVGCNAGTLIEVAYANQQGKPVASLEFWELVGKEGAVSMTVPTGSAEEAVEQVLGVLLQDPSVVR